MAGQYLMPHNYHLVLHFWWWLRATATAMANGDGNGNGWWQRQWRRSQQRRRRWQWGSQWWQPRKGNDDKGRIVSSCAGNVQRYGRGDTLPLPPWTQRKVHSPVLHHRGDTAKSVSSLSRGRVPDSSQWILFLFIIYNYCSVYWTTLCSPPALFRRSRTLSAHWCSTSSTPPRTSSAYWQSTPAPIALFVKVSPSRACND